MKNAMRAGDKERLKVVRLILAAIKQIEVDKRVELDDAGVLGVLTKMVKQRRDSIEQFEKGDREDLATIERAEIDTAHFKGNYPDRVSLEAALFDSDDDATNDSDKWQTLLPEAKLKMDQQHYFDDALLDIGRVSHVRMSIFPDGGVSRIRLIGRVAS